jgi:hypothetical protein
MTPTLSTAAVEAALRELRAAIEHPAPSPGLRDRVLQAVSAARLDQRGESGESFAPSGLVVRC